MSLSTIPVQHVDARRAEALLWALIDIVITAPGLDPEIAMALDAIEQRIHANRRSRAVRARRTHNARTARQADRELTLVGANQNTEG